MRLALVASILLLASCAERPSIDVMVQIIRCPASSCLSAAAPGFGGVTPTPGRAAVRVDEW